jgi:hypothetical protein
VRVSGRYYETFERMHYVCFHYAFEHGHSQGDGDPDETCGLDGCPSAPAADDKDRVVAVLRELVDDWADGPPADWGTLALPDYLAAVAAWLRDCDGHYDARGVPVPANGWEVVAAALRAAKAPE